jgi:hypothetical protein
MDHKNAKSVLIISLLVSVLSIFCALLGFLNENLYGNVISTGVFKTSFIPGAISYDITAIVSSIIIFILIVFYIKNKSNVFMISIIGLLSFFFYGYGTYVISALYTSTYLVYMLIFTLSIIGMIIGISGFSTDYYKILLLPRWIKNFCIIFLTLIVFIFVINWVTDIIPYTKSHTVPDFYAIYILDLCIFLPLITVIIFMLIKNIKFAYVLLGIALVKMATLTFSIVIGSLIAPKYGVHEEAIMIVIYCSLLIISIFVFSFYCIKMKHQVV